MKICLVGSTRFRDIYVKANLALTKKGHVVYSVAGYGHAEDEFTARDKEILDLVHLRKILESDTVVLVTDESHYYGDSTRRELTWAIMLQKSIGLYDPGEPSLILWDWADDSLHKIIETCTP